MAAGTYTVKVGKGGPCGTNGCDSAALALIAHGGGAGGSVKSGAGSVGLPGGSGGGGQRGGDGVVIVRVNRPSSVPRTFDGATGGAIRRSKGHFIHTFDANGTFVLPQAGWVEVLIVGGGGGGGANGTGDYAVYGGAGGGAGGFVYRQELLLDAGSYPVTVGAGGAIEQNGGNSSVFGLIAYGGGAGARYGSGWPRAQNGASGGGATISFEETMSGGVTRMGGKAVHDDPDGVQVNAGHDGGACSHCYGTSGGGGAGAPGGASTSSTPSAGGDGLPCSITGEEVWYAGGGGYRYNWSAGGLGGKGGGGSSSSDAARRKGVDGLGGGGSGGAAGGRGVVIIRYRYPPRGLILLVR